MKDFGDVTWVFYKEYSPRRYKRQYGERQYGVYDHF